MQKEKNFNENEIRPVDLMKDQHKVVLVDIGRLLTKREEFVEIDCPACGSTETRNCFKKYGLDYVACTSCETMYVNPRPSPAVLEWFYRESVNYAYWNKYIFPASEAARRQKIFVPRVDKVLEMCAKYGVETNSLLEVGAGFGTFCSEMQSRSVFEKVVGVEPTPDLAQTCRDKGIEIIEKPIEKIEFGQDNVFDALVNFEVIEHLFSPKEFLENCHRALKQNGLFVVTCPNGKGFDFVTLGHLCNSADHEHLNYFNPDSLSRLLERCGFEVLESMTPGRLDAELVRNKILSGEFDVSQHPFLQQVLVDKWDEVGVAFQDFLAASGLSSNMWIVARKR